MWTLIAALLGAALLLAVLFALRGGSAKRGSTVLLVGPSGGGKTAMFLQMRDARDIPTHMSMAPNEDAFALKGAGAPAAPVHVVDCPGAPQLQSQMLAKLAKAGVVVCVLDASDPLVHAKQAASVLYEIFTSDAMRRLRVPVLVACNKSDSAKAMRAVQLRGLVEKEIDRIQHSRSSMQDLSDKTHGSRISAEGVPFTFKEAPSDEVELADCCAKKPGLEPIASFISKHLRLA
ncbi:hypothetical protein KFE25_005889 [Diacronema lutheri]|uniref:Signal recognition particle receptor subunit beta n=2 Tax=Diacronema lutheri TaxID=2081491 RepID=A0A8J6CE96_DIALT|nr:hypothetical protein KFE25_005889 [Diacronema lutheri]